MAENRDFVVNSYEEYLADVRTMLEGEGVEWRKYAPPTLFEATDVIEKRVEALVAELSDDERLHRHSDTFVPSKVAEIWEDVGACAAFNDSFFDSLAMASAGRRRKKPAVRILHALGLHSGTATELKEALVSRLEPESWYEENFVGSDGDGYQ